MGGTFDPVHNGHLAVAQQARERFSLDRVLFIPNREPPHKKPYAVSPAEVRYEMVVLAIAGRDGFEASSMELERRGPSYTIDTLKELRRRLGDEAELFFITGADAVTEILTWKQPREIVKLCELIAATRPGADLSSLGKVVGPEIMAHVHQMEWPGMNVSSTMVRERVASGLGTGDLTPPAVAAYIVENGLYRSR
jgi:nicotinate-nucleotide adenylyltransferase